MLNLNTISEPDDSAFLCTRCLPWCRCRITKFCDSSYEKKPALIKKKGTIVDALWAFEAVGALGMGIIFILGQVDAVEAEGGLGGLLTQSMRFHH
jgi:hypothetical protein